MLNFKNKLLDFFHIREEAAQIEEDVKDLASAKLRYYKLWVFRLLVRMTSAISHSLIVGVVAVLAFLFLAFAAAYALGEYWNNISLGFLAVGGFFLLLLLIVYKWGAQKMQKIWLKKMSDIYFANEEDETMPQLRDDE